ncbi:DUF6397 family protein [Streptomyces sp. NPDC048389]|uniref:DUF6397 family protein n=1 Tax=Streptomyces sp. NPDC048389 TaxID=3154622 RepID=UPI0034570361
MTVQHAVTTSFAPGRAAQELGLRRGEFDLAVQLGQVPALPDRYGGPPRFDRREIERLRGRQGFPETLRHRLRTVGTADGAALVSISQGRFLGLARTGHLTPVRFYVNRYHAVVWRYLAEEVRGLARDHPALLTGAMPPRVRAALAAGEDRRPRNWRGRRLGQLLRLGTGPWQQAAAIAAVLDPVTIAEVVPDPYERSFLRVLRPEFASARPKSRAGQEIVERLLRADAPDEILWQRTSLADALRQAREDSPAPRPTPGRHRPEPMAADHARRRPPGHPPGRRAGSEGPVATGPRAPSPTASVPSRRAGRSLLGRLWRRRTARA